MVMQTSTFTEATRPTVPGNLLKLMIAKARDTTTEPGTIKSLVFNDTLPQGMGTTYNSPKIGALTAEGLTQGEDVTNFQQLTTSNVVITPGEVGLAVKFSKKSLAQWSEPMATRTGRIMRDAKDRKIDADLGGLSASFTTYTLGAATTVLTLGHLVAGAARLKGGNNTTGSAITAGAVSNQVPKGPINGVFRWESLTQVMRNSDRRPAAGHCRHHISRREWRSWLQAERRSGRSLPDQAGRSEPLRQLEPGEELR